MKILYLECHMGAAGDMLMSALSELHPQPEKFVETMNGLGISGVRFEKHRVEKMGIGGTQIRVTVGGEEEHSHHHHHHDEHFHHDHHHHDGHAHTHDHDSGASHQHRGMEEIENLIRSLVVSEKVKEDALAVYRLIAEAESFVHGKPVTQIHFHEVGTMDAVADIVGVCLLMEELAPDRILASPVHVGFGQVQCAHGVLPVPAPATAKILSGVPIYGGTIRGELCTPTGAALLRHFAGGFGEMPPMKLQGIGYGMGKKDFSAVNCVRALLGEAPARETPLGEASAERPAEGESLSGPNGKVTELSCNLDDMTGEALAFATQLLFEEGALDVFTQPIQMKKNRPGVLLTCICALEDADRLARLILLHTSTFGLRRKDCQRYTLDRTIREEETPFGRVRIKTGTGYGITKEKPEYEDLAAAAKNVGKTLVQIKKGIHTTAAAPKSDGK